LSPARQVSTDLLRKRWRFGEDDCRLLIPSLRFLESVDELWPSLRVPAGPEAHWKWQVLAGEVRERFALVDSANSARAVWCSGKPKAQLEAQTFYRLDYLEIRPDVRGARWGAFALSLVAKRAAELGCSGVLLASFEQTAAFYERLGASSRAVRGWKYPRSLKPYVFEGDAFLELGSASDEFLEK